MGAKAEKGVRDRFASTERLELLFVVMEAHLASAAVQEACVGALENLALNAEKKWRVKFTSLGGLKRVIAAMEAHVRSADVQIAACGVLKNVAVTASETREILGSAGHVIMASLDANMSCVEVQEAALAALLTLLGPRFKFTTGVEDSFARAIINQVVASMAAHIGSQAVQELGCVVLAKLPEDAFLPMTEFVILGALQSVYAAMDAHMASAGVQRHACEVLCCVASSDSVDLIPSGGLERVHRAMEGHPTSVTLQAASLELLVYVSDSAFSRAQLASGALNLRLDLVFAAMDAFPASKDVQLRGCRVFQMLSQFGGVAVAAGQSNVESCVKRVLAVLRAHSEDGCVQVAVFDAVCHWGNNADYRANILSSGCVGLAYRAVESYHEPDIAVHVSALGLLVVLVEVQPWDPQTLEAIASGLDQLSAILLWIDALAVYRACRVLANLVQDAGIATRFEAGGGLENVYAAMEAHVKDPKVQDAACCLVARLQQHRVVHGLASNAIPLARGLSGLYNAMQEHIASERVQQSAVTILVGMAASVAGMTRLRQGGRVAALLRRARAAHPDVALIANICDRLIHGLNNADCRCLDLAGTGRKPAALH
ncbi:MAG: hypothetical protein P4L40_04570 [Terracidiphilus sp.]|nr:hypothetical protein [Terracidiphilus sp.]